MENHIKVTDADGVQIIRFNRLDKKNAITAAMYQQMADAIDAANANSDIRCILFLGSQGVFTAGNDIADFAKIAQMTNGAEDERESAAVFQFLERIIIGQKPMVAGVDGLAIGVGTTMLMHCDYVIASPASVFRTPFVDLGVIPEAGSSLFAPRLMGHHKAFSLLVMGEKLTSADARAAGFVNSVVDSQDLETSAIAAAAAIAAKPPEALAISRKLIRGDRSDILSRMREEAVLFTQRLQSDEARQAFIAFMSR